MREFGPTGVAVPVIGQGTWKMQSNRKKSIEALRSGLDLGMTHIDTAEAYGSGRVEELVGEAIEGRRDEVFLVSKVSPSNATREGTVRACEASLERLGTDRLDVYLLHWPSRLPLEETIAGFEDLKRSGKIVAFGLSNFDVAGMQEAISIAGRGAIACNQVSYHLKDRDIESSVIHFCVEAGIAVVGYSPFGQGDFPSRNRVLNEIARRKGATPYQVALAFLTRWEDSFAIPKSSSIAHVEENAAAGDLKLTDEEVAAIDGAFPI
jgi:diketogulonate reductase-like aldo/keto reductase